MHKTSVINQKGGVGKTALSVGVAGALAEAGHRVLLVDLDPQGHATSEALQLPEATSEARLARALTGEYRGSTADLAVRHSRYDSGGHIDVWTNSVDMFLVDHKLELLRVKREGQLGRLLADVAGDYDHVIIDCPPALNALTDNALTDTDGLLIPLQLDPSSIRALKLLMDQIESLESQLGRAPINIHGVVPGMYRRPRSNLADSVLRDLESTGLPVLPHLPLAVVVPEAWIKGVPLTVHAPTHEHTTSLREIAAVLEKAAA